MSTTTTAVPDAPTDGPAVAREVHPRAIRWMHWINFPLLTIMIWSGLRIYWADLSNPYALGVGSLQFFEFLPSSVNDLLGLDRVLARGIAFHFSFGWLFVINGLAYLGYLTFSGQWRHIIPDRRAWSESIAVALHDLHLRKEAPAQGRYNAAQQITYTLVLVMGVLVVLSGFAIYRSTSVSPLTWVFGGYERARFVHFSVTIGFTLFFGLHLLQVARSGFGNFMSMITGYEKLTPSETSTEDDA